MKKVFSAFGQFIFDVTSAAWSYKIDEATATNTTEYDCQEMKEDTTEVLYLQWWRCITAEPFF